MKNDKYDCSEPVVCVNTGKHYKNIREAYNDTHCCSAVIERCCKGERFTSNGLSWVYERNYYEGMVPFYVPQRGKSANSHRGLLNKKDRKYIECEETGRIFSSEYSAYKYATNVLGIITTSMGIGMCLRNRKRDTSGYHWRFIEDNEKRRGDE